MLFTERDSYRLASEAGPGRPGAGPARASRFAWPALALLWRAAGPGLWQAVSNEKDCIAVSMTEGPTWGRAMRSWSLAAGRAGAAVVACWVLLSACGGGTGRAGAGPEAARSAVPGTVAATAPVTVSPGPTSPGPPPGAQPGSLPLSSTVSAIVGSNVTFTGEPVTAFAQVLSSAPVPLAVAWVDFGDGSGVGAGPAGPCLARPVQQFGVVNSAAVSHRYARPGRHVIRIWARLGCGTSQSVQYTTTTVFSYPSASPGASAWPRCQPGQLSATLVSLGAATGHVGAEIVLRNVSALPCHLYGFPGLQLLSADGAALPTTTHWGGSFLFPALRPHLVGLRTSQTASFDLAYTDVPVGDLPYQQACPAAATLVIIPPDDFASLRATARITPCEGDLDVSPIVPGTIPIPFD